MARRATVIDQERQKGGFVLVLDAGNSLVGDQNPAKRTQGETSVAAMNMMRYDAVGLGAKDLALGLKALRERMGEAEFTMLSANAVVSATGELVTAPYMLRPIDGHTIAIVGVTGGSSTEEIAVQDPQETAQAFVAEISSQADVIILLSTAGQETDQQIAEAVAGVDLIISGDPYQSATPWQADETGTLVLHADSASPGHAGRQIGIAHLAFDKEGQLVGQQWQRLSLGPEIASDPALSKWVAERMAP